MVIVYFILIVLLSFAAYFGARGRAIGLFAAGGMHSRPVYHGLLAAAWVGAGMLLIAVLGLPIVQTIVETKTLALLDPTGSIEPLKRSSMLREVQEVAIGRVSNPSPALMQAAGAFSSLKSLLQNSVLGIGLVAGIIAFIAIFRSIDADYRARNRFERFVRVLLMMCAGIAVLTTIGIVFSVLFETMRFFQKVPPADFLFGTQWSPQAAIRADQGGSSGAFGIVPLVVGTLLISTIAILVAGPIGLFAAIYMAEYATPKFRAFAKPILEILAGIPTVVLGFFAALTIAPLIRDTGMGLGLNVASESALAAGLVMGMMIIPFVSSLSDDVISAVPQSLRDGSYGLGATQSETIRKVVLPAALPGIVSAFMLAISRAVGETMIVVMAAGLAANLSFNPLDAVTTFTVQIKTILVGDQEFDSAKTLAAFALGFVLFFFTLALNVIALGIVRKYREQYD